MDTRIANRYAKALFDLARETKALETVRTDVAGLRVLISDSPEFVRFTNNPLIPSHRRQAVLAELFGERTHTATFTFLQLLEKKGRLGLIVPICERFEGLCLEAEGVTDAHIQSAHPLAPQQVDALATRLGEKLGRTIRPHTEVVPGLLGGFTVQVGDHIYDASAATLLQTFKEKLIHA